MLEAKFGNVDDPLKKVQRYDMGQGIQEWTKYNLLKAVFHNF